jgi:hypothetical protein
MRLNDKKTALYVFLLAAAGIGLLIDRSYAPPKAKGFVAGGGAPSRDSNSVEEESSWDIGPPIAALFASSRPATRPKERLSPAAAGLEVRDVFALSPRLQELYQAKTKLRRKAQETPKTKSEEARELAETFRKSHRLKGVFVRPADQWAVVDDRILRVGDRLDGFELRRIEDYRAFFAKEGLLVPLSLPRTLDAKVDFPASR